MKGGKLMAKTKEQIEKELMWEGMKIRCTHRSCMLNNRGICDALNETTYLSGETCHFYKTKSEFNRIKKVLKEKYGEDVYNQLVNRYVELNEQNARGKSSKDNSNSNNKNN